MGKESAIMLVILFALVCALGFGFYEVFSVDQAKKRGSTTALTRSPPQTGTPPTG